jgi:putative ABC transport system substrate-binding protein
VDANAEPFKGTSEGAKYVEKLFKGAAPVEWASKVDLVVNLKTGQGAWRHDPANAGVARGRGDSMIDRRSSILALAASFLTSRRAANAQPTGKVRKIGYVGNLPRGSSADSDRIFDAFVQTLRERGFVEGKNLAFEFRFTEGVVERSPALVGELVRLGVDVIVVGSGPGARAAKDATSTIPIVMIGVSDPVGAGLVASLARPGGNITGIADLQIDLINKRLELLKAAAPKIAQVAYLFGNYSGFDDAKLKAVAQEREAAAQALGLRLLSVQMNTPQDFEDATAAIVRARPDALLISPNPTNFILRHQLAEFALRLRLPTIAARRQEAAAGVLMAYGPKVEDIFRAAAIYVAKILNGATPAELPIEQPTTFEFVVNAKTARALGITIPQSLLLRADELIQ